MKNKNPTIVVINGANWFGSQLVNLLISNEGNVIVVDDFNEKTVPFIKKFSNNKKYIFIEKSKLDSIQKNFTKIKYFIHLKNDSDTTDNEISSRNFLKETKFTDDVLNIALDKNSSYILVSSIHLHKDFILKKNLTREKGKAYSESDLQDYVEKIVIEYVEKAGLNGRVARIGNVYGPEMDLSKDPLLLQIISDAFFKDEIRIYGDGLEFMYYIYVNDCLQGILKALFTPMTKGKIYSITNSEEISVLSIVNKILSFGPRAQRIKFLKGHNMNPLYEKAYIPDSNLEEIGWHPLMPFERGLLQVYEYFRNYIYKNNLSNQDKEKYIYSAENIEVNYQDNLENTELEFNFDETINLSENFYSPNNYEDIKQFKDFHKKLNNPESPIYNLNSKKFDNYDLHPYLAEQKNKSLEIWKNLALIVWTFSIFVFLIIPFVRVSLFYNSFHSYSENFANSISSNNYQNNIERVDFVLDLDDSIITVDWVIRSANQRDKKIEYVNLLNAIEQSAGIYNSLKNNNLHLVIFENTEMSEENATLLRNIIPQIQSAIDLFEKSNDVLIMSETRENLDLIYNWLKDLKFNIEEKLY